MNINEFKNYHYFKILHIGIFCLDSVLKNIPMHIYKINHNVEK